MTLPRGDIVIVGGGPAGATAAITLSRRAPALLSRLVVLEKGAYPRDKTCAGALGRRGERILEALDASPDVPSVPIDGIAFRTREGQIVARSERIGRVIRRIEFDRALVDIARRRGVRVQEDTRVLAVREDGDGAVVETTRGTIRASVVVGADGVGSVVRRSMGLGPGRLRAQALEVDTEPTRDDLDRGLLLFDVSDRTFTGYAWDFPTIVDGRALVCRGVYWLNTGRGPADVHGILAARLASIGLDLARYAQKRFAERGHAPPTVVARGPMLLVGEAAGVDPVTGEGIPQAIESGEAAGRFLADGIDTRPVSDWNDLFRRSRLAWDLDLRTRAVRAFYGRTRPEMEAFALACPAAIHLGCQHFAGVPYDRPKLAEVLLLGGLRLAELRLREMTERQDAHVR